MRFRFNDRKTAQAAAHLLKMYGGKANYMQLIKLLYLADREMILSHGQPITGDVMYSMKNGPVLSQVLNFVNEGDEHHSAWFDYVSPPIGYDVQGLKAEPETDELSRFELRLLDKVYEQYGKMDKWELVRLLHDILPEWKDPGRSRFPIEAEDILRAESRSEAEIEEANETAKDIWLLSANAD